MRRPIEQTSLMGAIQVAVAMLLAAATAAGCVSSRAESPIPDRGSAVMKARATDCQLLLTEDEAERQGIARQRAMYPAASRRRLSDRAARDGFRAATRDEAMREFNRAWRFDPENPMAYWGAAIVRGCEASRYCDEDRGLARGCWAECVALFEKGALCLNGVSAVRRCEYQMDQAVAYANYAQFLRGESAEQAAAWLEKAAALILPYHDCRLFGPEENRRVNVRVAWQLKNICASLGKDAEAAKYEAEFLKQATDAEKGEFGSTAPGGWSE